MYSMYICMYGITLRIYVCRGIFMYVLNKCYLSFKCMHGNMYVQNLTCERCCYHGNTSPLWAPASHSLALASRWRKSCLRFEWTIPHHIHTPRRWSSGQAAQRSPVAVATRDMNSIYASNFFFSKCNGKCACLRCLGALTFLIYWLRFAARSERDSGKYFKPLVYVYVCMYEKCLYVCT